jgi:hypothetical protein
MRMRVLGRKLSAIACGVLSAGVLVVASASPAGAEPDGMLATAELGVRFKDDSNNGQCRVDDGSTGESVQWVPEGQWTLPLVLDTDNRSGGCGIWLGFNNQDGSLTGFNLNYLFAESPGGANGQCPGVAGTQIVPIMPVPFFFRYWMDPRITVDSDGRPGWCDLTLTATGRADVVLDVLWEFNGDGGQCHGALPLGTNQYRTVQTGALPVTMGFDSDNRGGACFLSFRLRHLN